MVKNNRKIFP